MEADSDEAISPDSESELDEHTLCLKDNSCGILVASFLMLEVSVGRR
jgi:hypothetical protein